ncbi:poly(A)-binding protein binding protein [Coemansia sp. RSA 552]|nr:poly(A)-binding protein binding protein [Coemansia sp. RSA 552]
MATFNDKGRSPKTGPAGASGNKQGRWSSGPPQFGRAQKGSPVHHGRHGNGAQAPAAAPGGGRSFSSVTGSSGSGLAAARPAAQNKAALHELIEGEAVEQVEAMNQRLLYLLSYLVGTHVKVATTSGDVYVGVLCSINPTDAQSVVLRYAYDQNGSKTAAPVDTLVIPGDECLEISGVAAFSENAGADGSRTGFKTDVDISGAGGQVAARELHRWVPDDADGLEPLEGGLETGTRPGKSWDQFATNEQLFGLTTDFDEEIYTTKLDRTRADFKEREREAIRIAQEIQSTPFLNSHVAEERQDMAPADADDGTMDEEDKYGAVLRPTGAQGKYVPPYMRSKTDVPAPTSKPQPAPSDAPEIPELPVAAQPNNAMAAAALAKLNIRTTGHSSAQEATDKPLEPAGVQRSSAATPASSGLAADPAITALGRPPTTPVNSKLASLRGNKHRTDAAALNKPMADITEKLNSERARVQQQKQALLKTRVSELVKFHQSFKLTSPMPDDVAEIVGARRKSGSPQTSTSSSASPEPATSAPETPATASGGASQRGQRQAELNHAAPKKAAEPKEVARSKETTRPEETARPEERAESAAADKPEPGKDLAGDKASGAGSKDSSKPTDDAKKEAKKPAFKFNAKASSFKPSAAAAPFVPKFSASSSRTSSSADRAEHNAFFGRRTLKRAPLPLWGGAFKFSTEAECGDDGPTWPFGSRTYRSQFVAEEPEAMMYPQQGFMPPYGYGYYPQYQYPPHMGMVPPGTQMPASSPYAGAAAGYAGGSYSSTPGYPSPIMVDTGRSPVITAMTGAAMPATNPVPPGQSNGANGSGAGSAHPQMATTPEMGPAMVQGQAMHTQPGAAVVPPPYAPRSGSDSPNLMYGTPPPPGPPVHMGMVPPPMPFNGMPAGGYMAPMVPPPQGYPSQSMPMPMGYAQYPPPQGYSTSPPPGMPMMHGRKKSRGG